MFTSLELKLLGYYLEDFMPQVDTLYKSMGGTKHKYLFKVFRNGRYHYLYRDAKGKTTQASADDQMAIEANAKNINVTTVIGTSKGDGSLKAIHVLTPKQDADASNTNRQIHSHAGFSDTHESTTPHNFSLHEMLNDKDRRDSHIEEVEQKLKSHAKKKNKSISTTQAWNPKYTVKESKK